MNTPDKTLLQWLVEELPKHGGWPEKAKTATQSVIDGEIYFRDRFDQLINRGIKLEKVVKLQSSRVTRDQYEAALAEKGIHTVKVECQVVDADGWIDWHGGECPVSSHTSVDVKFRDSSTDYGHSADSYTWKHSAFGMPGLDIIAYRLHQPQDANSRANDDRLEADLNECIGQAPGAPVWNGEGVPPIGAAIVWREGKRWYPGTVTGVGEQLIIIKDQHGEEGSYRLDVAVIRPATFERDELADALEQSADKHRGFVDVFKLVADDLMAAGYRKQ